MTMLLFEGMTADGSLWSLAVPLRGVMLHPIHLWKLRRELNAVEVSEAFIEALKEKVDTKNDVRLTVNREPIEKRHGIACAACGSTAFARVSAPAPLTDDEREGY